MKDTILFEIEYDKDGNPDIRVAMNMAKKGRIVFRMKDYKIPNFEDLPETIQIESVYRLSVIAIENLSAAAKEIVTSEKKAKNKRKFDPTVMDSYVSIVEESRRKKPTKYWDDALEECAKYSKKNHSDPVYIKISRMDVAAFTKMIGHYRKNPPL
jgi:hypothetical protein